MEYTIKEAMEYSKRNELDKWCQAFLRDTTGEHPGDNFPLADGLLLEDRFYIGPVLIDFDKLIPIRLEKDIDDPNDLKYFNEVVDSMCKNYANYNFPPFIVEYRDNNFYLTDGCHRYSALKRLNIAKYYAIIWGNKELEKELSNYKNTNSR